MDYTDEEFNQILDDFIKWGLISAKLESDGESSFKLNGERGLKYSVVLSQLLEKWAKNPNKAFRF